jgi:predicted acylesterase/phospholipase RssA
MRFDDAFWQRIQYLVFSGGAMNGLADVGVLQVLETAYPKLYEQTQGYAGTSMGALVALLLCIGYTSASMRAVIDAFDSSLLFSRTDNMFQNLGMVDAMNSLGKLVGDLIQRHMGKPDVNFAELFRRTRQELTVVVVNFSKKRVEYWNRHTQPGLSVLLATVCSLALPLVFTPVVGPGGDLFIDGGLGDNFPLHLYPADRTLGVRIDVTPQPPFRNMIDYGMALLDLKSVLDQAGRPKSVSLAPVITIQGAPSMGLNFFLSSAQRSLLMDRGIATTLVWLLQWPLILCAWCTMQDISWSKFWDALHAPPVDPALPPAECAKPAVEPDENDWVSPGTDS